MKKTALPALIILCALLTTCGDNPKDHIDEMTEEWRNIKTNAAPVVVLTSEFGTPYRQPLSNMGWEDGICISRDGLDLYCVYVPGDILSFNLAGLDPDQFGSYLRGPLFGMDLVTNPAGRTSWIHGDILYSHRNTVSDMDQLKYFPSGLQRRSSSRRRKKREHTPVFCIYFKP